ncbi:DUF3861 domain-containing protein [Pararhodospirillum photometricum]|nr:DUF3861 domain-containing protein [Pararhodospirillum photometricum]
MMPSYSIIVTPHTPDQVPFRFEVRTHDDLKEIIGKVSAKGWFDEEETKAFCVGLKLFSGVMLKHRQHSLFAEFLAPFGAFMKTLKTWS